MTPEMLQNLAPGEVLARSEGFSGPVHGKVPFLDLGPYPSDEFVALRMRERFASWRSRTRYTEHDEKAPPIIIDDFFREEETTEVEPGEAEARAEEKPHRILLLPDVPPSRTAMRLLEDIATFSDSTILQRYARLGLSGSKGDRARKELLQRGFIVGKPVKTAGRPRIFYTISDFGRQQLERKT